MPCSPRIRSPASNASPCLRLGAARRPAHPDMPPAKPADPLLALLAPKPDPIGEIAGAPPATRPAAVPAAPVEPAKGEARVETPALPVVRLEPPKPAGKSKAPRGREAPESRV